EALHALGADVICERGGDCPPVIVRADGLPGGTATVAGDVSSQFLSALLMAAPCAHQAVELKIEGELVSEPYVEMTRRVMASFGVHVAIGRDAESSFGRDAESSERSAPLRIAADRRFRIEPASYQARDYQIEPDASAASYFFAVAAITGGEVTVEGLTRESLQGDVRFIDVLERMGCEVVRHPDAIGVRGGSLRGIDVDMNAISDTAQTLAAVAVFAEGPTRIRNVAHVRHKETDRIAAVATELRRLGQTVEEFDDGLVIHPAPPRPATIETYDDHRMAMSFALVGLRVPGVRIADPGCTAKTYPRFFDDLRTLCGG
ncbi:MAG: 3-phosphoshikimate 1-carboxyvinyltransferase, partial [Planctomycetaceae bacterium]